MLFTPADEQQEPPPGTAAATEPGTGGEPAAGGPERDGRDDGGDGVWPRWLTIGLAVAVLVAGAGLVAAWQLDARAGARAGAARVRTAYAAGHQAYLVGDCTRAVTQFDLLLAMPDLPAQTAGAARAQRTACAGLAAVRTAAGGTDRRVLDYLTYLAADPPDPLDGVAAQDVERTLATSPVEQLATPALCARADDVVRLVTGTARRGVGAPRLLLACGEAARKAGDGPQALAFYDRVKAQFPTSVQATQADISAGRLRGGPRKERFALTLTTPRPASDGSAPGPADRARVVVRNGAPTGLLVSLTGPGSERGSAAACPGCAVGRAGADARCPADAPAVVLDVAPGRYTARVRGTGAARAAVATWTLAAGRTVEVCVGAARTG